MTHGIPVSVAMNRAFDFMASPWVPTALKREFLQSLSGLAALRVDTMLADPDATRTSAFIVCMLSAMSEALIRSQVASQCMKVMVSMSVTNRDEWLDGVPPYMREHDSSREASDMNVCRECGAKLLEDDDEDE